MIYYYILIKYIYYLLSISTIIIETVRRENK